LRCAFDLEDPDPSAIRAPLGDHDAVNGASHDFAGVVIDPLNSHSSVDTDLHELYK